MQIKTPAPNDQDASQQIAHILVEGFKENWPTAYNTVEDGLEEVQDSFAPGRISRMAVADDGTLTKDSRHFRYTFCPNWGNMELCLLISQNLTLNITRQGRQLSRKGIYQTNST